MQLGSYMPVTHKRKWYFCYDIITIFYPYSFINPFVVGRCKSFIANSGAAEQDHLNISVRIIIFDVNGTQNRQGSPQRMPGNLYIMDIVRY